MKWEFQRARPPWIVPALLCLGLLWMSGLHAFDINLGPKIKDRIVFIQTTTANQRNVEMVRVTQGKTVEVWVQDSRDGSIYVAECELKNCILVRPDVAVAQGLTAPRVAVNVIVRVLREDGKPDKLDVGGWYVKPETIKTE